MTHADLTTPARFIAQLPATLRRVPRMLRGLYYAGIRNREKTLSLAWALERAAKLYPNRPAVLDEQRQLSYASFNAWANRLARAFKAEGVGHGSVVAVMLESRIEVLAVLAALAKLGGRRPGQHHPARPGADPQPESGQTQPFRDRRRTTRAFRRRPWRAAQ